MTIRVLIFFKRQGPDKNYEGKDMTSVLENQDKPANLSCYKKQLAGNNEES
jgi:hypothetical protein